jgi:hypothetical protein
METVTDEAGAESSHDVADVMKRGMAAAISFGLRLEKNFEAECQNALWDVGGPSLSA